jgi:hypothetical protein
MLEASPEDLELQKDQVVVKGVPGKIVTLQELAASSMVFAGKVEPI